MELFGFEISRKKDEEEQKKRQSFVAPDTDDGASVVSEGGHYGQYVDIEGTKAKDDADLIKKYREISLYPECDAAITDIINEAIVADEDTQPVRIITDDVEYSEKIKKIITDEFKEVLRLLKFNINAHDIFRKWYVDGRLYYHMIIDEKNPKNGILELRPIDSLKIRKVRQIIEEKDPKTGARLVKGFNEFYIYQDVLMSGGAGIGGASGLRGAQGLRISKDSIIYTPSGLIDATSKKMLSHLYKALKPVNQLRMMEDSLVIYRMARAPERRIFYIDVGNLPKGKAEAYLRDIMARYKNKIVYDASTGEIRDDRKHMAMLEDFWLPRREGGKGTEISTLPGGENLGQIEDIIYFQKKLYRSLNVPMSRMESESSGFNLGRSSEISRDELKFTKFVSRLRKKFADLLLQTLKTQLILKGIINKDDWEKLKEQIKVDFFKDNYFAELKEGEILRERLNTLALVDPYVGKYYSQKWIKKHVLQFTDDEIEEMDEEISEEEAPVSDMAAGPNGMVAGDAPPQDAPPAPPQEAPQPSNPFEPKNPFNG
jgi:hypothetical protein